MKKKPSVVIYGRSLFSHAIEATLAELQSIQVIRYSPDQVIDPEETAWAALIIVEADSRISRQLALIERYEVPILVVNAPDGQITVINKQQHDFHQMTDLVSLITGIARPVLQDETLSPIHKAFLK
ncbi:MAG: hypothetical protein GWP17_00015 [Aquificales bacterium]|nr:hypothetical protein [Aquificales bacterium]